MSEARSKILWVDDEIELLRPHVLFLESKGYAVHPVTNADDAVQLIRDSSFDLVLLDEMMPGKDGLSALAEIKEINPALPVVMVTKNEEERLMEEAIGSRIADYLTKPVNPSQILSTCKKILDSRKITGARVSREYIAEFNAISRRLLEPLTWKDWIEIYLLLSEWEVELDRHADLGLRQTLADQKRECNAEFAKFIEKNYPGWAAGQERPPLSIDVVKDYVIPPLQEGKRVAFLVMDNLRLDQWLTIEPLIRELFTVNREHYFAILPTATPYARNAIFAGLFPRDIQREHPDLWAFDKDDDSSLNRHEHAFLEAQLQRLKVHLRPPVKYIKVLDQNEAKAVEKQIGSYAELPLLALVINFVDILAHSRSDSEVLREITPDEAAYRSLTKSWFEHSPLYRILRELSQRGNTVIVTSDHGSIRGMRGAKVIGDRETSTNLRYKFGRSLKADPKQAIIVQKPETYQLPSLNVTTNFLFAKEDYYFVYPTNYHHYLNYYRDSLQHGGVSLEEMILPIVRLEPIGGRT
ncbi:response regulator [bacterium]|nr:MAG: PglZ domain-containing protein [candidate division KSB1 bacterium]MCE7942876.1 PglZ domain-containing protein [Chlorobi bacterium CHB1]MCL4707112.1 response regulator [bacterium]MDL1878633.1 bifunctional response regulator/alkaline phosphatase family protein [Cytophagia bacterium CHB2]MBC6946913.1 PglZ domain-containing protein [candidate division KSB1 bacterium]